MSGRNQPSYRVYCRASPYHNLTVSDGVAILAPINENDDRQYWHKDDKYSYIKDAGGLPAFSLVNKATGQTLKHFFKHYVPVRLVDYNPCVLDKSVLWAQADDRGEGYAAIRSLNANDTHLEAAALDNCSYRGAIIVGGFWRDDKNQHWKIERRC
ncbi:ricin B-like lectin R40G3 [Tripterygium wilfordii]|uniref:ricin B-like lectin R40G3 n=1 Tax=Tripterygium wilfordii TaxID=458696 RepID=UPI0018F8254B|nr:ricin B-like lectin R40G3 [Tripterygium wilfordii]XP_038721436.1 ricin B-like lectin R40G3 [Tripterygium wilfordii]